MASAHAKPGGAHAMQAMAREDYEAAAQYVKDFLDLDAQAAPVQDQVEGTQAEQQAKVSLSPPVCGLGHPACLTLRSKVRATVI